MPQTNSAVAAGITHSLMRQGFSSFFFQHLPYPFIRDAFDIPSNHVVSQELQCPGTVTFGRFSAPECDKMGFHPSVKGLFLEHGAFLSIKNCGVPLLYKAFANTFYAANRYFIAPGNFCVA